MTSIYNKAVELLTSQGKFHISLGLDRMSKIMNILDNPQDKIKIIHIAGTNGKGSVSAILSNILKTSGYNVGLYTSPHLIEYTERIKINNQDITKEDFGNYIEIICSEAEKNNIDLTEFEILTASAFKYFYDKKVDIAIIETGLGGKYDATNIVQNPLISVITSISLDHTDILGNSYETIAKEKAGIIKQNSNVVVSQNNKGYDIIKETTINQNSQLKTVYKNIQTIYENNKNYAIINNKKQEFSLIGLYQQENLALALSTIEMLNQKGISINNNSIINGLKTIKWAARLEFIKEKNILIDGAHNPDGAKHLKESLDYYFPNEKRIYIYSTLNTKDYKKIASILFEESDEIYFYEFNHKNAVKFEDYTKNVPNLKNIKIFNKENLTEIINQKGLKIITGSLYMIGDLYQDIKNK